MPDIDKEISYFALTNYRNQRRKFGIKLDDRRKHMYVIGKTGMGKTTMLENLVISDILAGHGLCFIDPHGDSAEKILDYIPSERINDVVYFNPADVENPIAFNPLENVSEAHKHLIGSGLVQVFKKLWADTWGPRLEYLLRNAIMALLDYPGSTLLGVTRMMIDKAFRNKVVAKIKDPVIRQFWTEEYTKYSGSFQTEAISPIQNKVGQFLSNFLIRNIVGQVKSTIDIREIMDEGKILIMNLSKGRVGEDASMLLGSMMITKIQLSAMSRVDVPESERRDFFLYVDEFQNYATDSFADILSEARKYHLNLTLAHQFIEQLSDIVKAAVFGNMGSLVCFRVGAIDAEELVKEFTPQFTEEDLVNLTKWDIYLKLMIDGVSSSPFSATTLPPIHEASKVNNSEKVIQVSRERYSKERSKIEDKIARWSMPVEDLRGSQGKPNEDTKRPSKKYQGSKSGSKPVEIKGLSKEEDLKTGKPKSDLEILNPKVYPHEVICSNCGQATRVSFKPTSGKPIYCKTCLNEVRSEKAKNTAEMNEAKQKAFQERNQEAKAEPPKEVSLKDAMQQGAVDFKGRKAKIIPDEVKNKEFLPSVEKNDPKDPTLPASSASQGKSQKLEPGKKMKISND